MPIFLLVEWGEEEEEEERWSSEAKVWNPPAKLERSIGNCTVHTKLS